MSSSERRFETRATLLCSPLVSLKALSPKEGPFSAVRAQSLGVVDAVRETKEFFGHGFF